MKYMLRSKPYNYNIIGQRIAEMRKAQNMSADELCDKLALFGISIGWYRLSLWENQEADIYDFEILALAKALDVSVESLFIGLNDPRLRYNYFD